MDVDVDVDVDVEAATPGGYSKAIELKIRTNFRSWGLTADGLQRFLATALNSSSRIKWSEFQSVKVDIHYVGFILPQPQPHCRGIIIIPPNLVVQHYSNIYERKDSSL